MLIVKTERLHQRRASLPPAELAEQSLNLAVEQRMIRAEFVFMLGGEINDEEVEAEQSVELQAGRLQNRGQRDLRAATIAMSQAEKLLTGANTADALVAERAAVTALQRAFSRDRYILRALATRSQLDPARRLTGSLADAAGLAPRRRPTCRRTGGPRCCRICCAGSRSSARLSARPEGRALQPEGSATADVRRARPSGRAEPDAFRQRALVLAEEAIRIDPASALAAAGGDGTAARRRRDRSRRAIEGARRRRGRPRRRRPGGRRPTRRSRRPPSRPALSGAFADAMGARLKARATASRRR